MKFIKNQLANYYLSSDKDNFDARENDSEFNIIMLILSIITLTTVVVRQS